MCVNRVEAFSLMEWLWVFEIRQKAIAYFIKSKSLIYD